jgi:hypothetical protein
MEWSSSYDGCCSLNDGFHSVVLLSRDSSCFVCKAGGGCRVSMLRYEYFTGALTAVAKGGGELEAVLIVLINNVLAFALFTRESFSTSNVLVCMGAAADVSCSSRTR